MISESPDTITCATEARLTALEVDATLREEELHETKARLSRAETRIRVTWMLASTAMLTAFILAANKDSKAQGYGTTLAQVLSRVVNLETKTAPMSLVADKDTGLPTVRFEGVNVQIVDGSGDTFGSVNGLGNLTIGYNESRFPLDENFRTGSHNMIVGTRNNYTSFGGLVAGDLNTISGPNASVSGGANNTASGHGASVSGGAGNKSLGQTASITGGVNSAASGAGATVSGGSSNTASGNFSSVGGGALNEASAQTSTVSGGQSRDATGTSDWVAGSLLEQF